MRSVAHATSTLNGTYVAVEFSCESANVPGAKSWVASSGGRLKTGTQGLVHLEPACETVFPTSGLRERSGAICDQPRFGRGAGRCEHGPGAFW